MENFRFKGTYFDKDELRELIDKLGDEGEVISKSHLLSLFLQDYSTQSNQTDNISNPCCDSIQQLGGFSLSAPSYSTPITPSPSTSTFSPNVLTSASTPDFLNPTQTPHANNTPCTYQNKNNPPNPHNVDREDGFSLSSATSSLTLSPTSSSSSSYSSTSSLTSSSSCSTCDGYNSDTDSTSSSSTTPSTPTPTLTRQQVINRPQRPPTPQPLIKCNTISNPQTFNTSQSFPNLCSFLSPSLSCNSLTLSPQQHPIRDNENEIRLRLGVIIGTLFDTIRLRSGHHYGLKYTRRKRCILSREGFSTPCNRPGKRPACEVVSLADFIDTLSVICRGDRQEKMELVFDICDINNDNRVKKEELLLLGRSIHTLLSLHFQNSIENLPSPEESVNDIFLSNKPLSLHEFIKVADQDPDVHRCFGLFDYFYFTLVRPIEQKLGSFMFAPPPKQTGYIFKKKKIPILHYYTVRWFEIRDRFLIYYKRFSRKKRPRKVICLLHSTVRVIYTKKAHKPHKKNKSKDSGGTPPLMQPNTPATLRKRKYPQNKVSFKMDGAGEKNSRSSTSSDPSQIANNLNNLNNSNNSNNSSSNTNTSTEQVTRTQTQTQLVETQVIETQTQSTTSKLETSSQTNIVRKVSFEDLSTQETIDMAKNTQKKPFGKSTVFEVRGGKPIARNTRLYSVIATKFLSNRDAKRILSTPSRTDFVLKVGNYARRFSSKSEKQAYEWINSIRANSKGGYRFQSFAPIRQCIASKWYVNACSYFEDLATHLPQAQQEIFISGWWFSPELYLKRGGSSLSVTGQNPKSKVEYFANECGEKVGFDEKYRLDNILAERARSGVKVYILIWNETNLSGLELGSQSAQLWMESLSKNITVIRHPKYVPLSWSHHQKIVIIDQAIAYLGGIDLCYGRYDDDKFSLFDAHEKVFPGADYGNHCLIPFRAGHPNVSALDRRMQARMPWHDVSVRVDGLAARDVSLNFMQRWNYARDKSHPFLLPSDYDTPPATNSFCSRASLTAHAKFYSCDKAFEKRESSNLSEIIADSIMTNLNESVDALPIEEKFSTPTFDVRTESVLESELEDDFENELEENNDNHIESKNNFSLLSLLPPPIEPIFDKNQDLLVVSPSLQHVTKENEVPSTLSKLSHTRSPNLLRQETSSLRATQTRESVSAREFTSSLNANFTTSTQHRDSQGNIIEVRDTRVPFPQSLDSYSTDICTVQITRSVGQWSAGQQVEDSCYKSYVTLINRAKHFIFIQNQYFISSIEQQQSQPKNKLALAIVRRIRKAILKNDKFRVIILLPVHSEGDLSYQSTRLLVAWTLKTIKSMYTKLQEEFPSVNIHDYLSFHSLRTWSKFGGYIFSEMVYVHSKLMIVDDQTVIIGSANLNDRSLRGERDSEICAVVEGGEMVNSRMADQKWTASLFALSLRLKLWRCHLGMATDTSDEGYYDERILDPVSDETFLELWQGFSFNNTKIYSAVFGYSIPENCELITQLTRGKLIPSGEIEEENLKNVRGLLIDYPMKMLEKEELSPAALTPEWFVNTSVFL